MTDLLKLLDEMETRLRWPVGPEQSAAATLWRELVMLRAEALTGGADDERLAAAVDDLARRAEEVWYTTPPADSPQLRSDPEIGTLSGTITRAVRAPSLHNAQPWRFRISPDGVEVRLDPDRMLPVADPDRRAARVACGAAVLNLRLAFAIELGRDPEVDLLPESSDPDLIARVLVGPARPATPRERLLYRAIGDRRSNRYPFRDLPVPREARALMTAAARSEGCWLEIVSDPTRRLQVADLTRQADRMLMDDPGYRHELAAWSHADPSRTDGVLSSQAGVRPEPYDLLPIRDYGGPARRPGRDYESEPLLAVLGGYGDSDRDHVIAGQALQRVWLSATSSGLAMSIFSQPFEVPAARRELRTLLSRVGTPHLVLRAGYGRHALATPRRSVYATIDVVETL